VGTRSSEISEFNAIIRPESVLIFVITAGVLCLTANYMIVCLYFLQFWALVADDDEDLEEELIEEGHTKWFIYKETLMPDEEPISRVKRTFNLEASYWDLIDFVNLSYDIPNPPTESPKFLEKIEKKKKLLMKDCIKLNAKHNPLKMCRLFNSDIARYQDLLNYENYKKESKIVRKKLIKKSRIINKSYFKKALKKFKNKVNKFIFSKKNKKKI